MSSVDRKVSAARVSVISNSLLVLLKLAVGIAMGSVGVLSEALHSGIDLVAALLARYSVVKSAEPADAEHRFGHGKFENMSGMIEGTLIFVAAIVIIYEAGRRLFERYEVELLDIGMAVMALSAVINFLVSRYLHKVAEETDSLALEADARHLEADVWTSVGVFVALVLIYLTGIKLIDPIIGLVVAVLIIRAAYEITKKSVSGLLDQSLPDQEIRAIERIMNSHSAQFVNFHKLRARKTGSERQIDLHLTVPRSLSVKDGHDLVDHLEAEIKSVLPNSVIVIHIEPCDSQCEKCALSPEEPFTGGES